MLVQDTLDLQAWDVLAAGDDVLRAVLDLDVAGGVTNGEVPCVELASGEGSLGGGLVAVVARDQRIALQDDLTDGGVVTCNVVPLLVDDADTAGRDMADALTRQRSGLVLVARHGREPSDKVAELAVGVAPVVQDHGRPIGIDSDRALKEIQRRQRPEVRLARGQMLFLSHGDGSQDLRLSYLEPASSRNPNPPM